MDHVQVHITMGGKVYLVMTRMLGPLTPTLTKILPSTHSPDLFFTQPGHFPDCACPILPVNFLILYPSASTARQVTARTTHCIAPAVPTEIRQQG